MQIELQEFVKESLKQKVARPAIQQALKDAGWPDDEVAAALAQYADTEFAVPVPKRKPQVSAGETFKYLSAFACLTVSATALGRLVFYLIDSWVPDPFGYTGSGDLTGVRMAVASLMVAFPIYLALVVMTERAVRRDPTKRALGVRKWLIYLTLFVTGSIIIGDVITLVYGFLAGDNDLRSLLKLFSTLGIAGAIFGIEAWKLRRSDDAAAASSGRKVVLGLALAAVFAALIGGLFIAGPPGKQRDQRMDAERSNDLSAISRGLLNWRSVSFDMPLPESLEPLVENGMVTARVNDPETGEPYGYRVVKPTTVELCATFATDSTGGMQPKPPPKIPDFSRHAKGRQCFTMDLGPSGQGP